MDRCVTVLRLMLMKVAKLEGLKRVCYSKLKGEEEERLMTCVSLEEEEEEGKREREAGKP